MTPLPRDEKDVLADVAINQARTALAIITDVYTDNKEAAGALLDAEQALRRAIAILKGK